MVAPAYKPTRSLTSLLAVSPASNGNTSMDASPKWIHDARASSVNGPRERRPHRVPTPMPVSSTSSGIHRMPWTPNACDAGAALTAMAHASSVVSTNFFMSPLLLQHTDVRAEVQREGFEIGAAAACFEV